MTGSTINLGNMTIMIPININNKGNFTIKVTKVTEIKRTEMQDIPTQISGLLIKVKKEIARV